MNKKQNDVLLSIIVPVYNVEDFLQECMESINVSINNIDAEVLLIDDGSKDNSAEIAKAYVKEHPKFKYHHKENGGLADARNFGISKAQGKYLSFIDSDDLVTEDMFEKMIASAETHDTDLTIINVARFDSKKIFDASLYIRMFSDVDETVTHIKDCDRLIFDTIVCNKLVRRDFWVDNGFEFPVGFRFEDMAVALAMHCKARRVSIVKTVGYLWRVREGESRSITQENTKTVNLEHRLFMLNRMFDYIHNDMGGDKRLESLLKMKVLSLDLIIYINAMADMPHSAQEEFQRIIMDFYNKHFDRSDIDSLSALNYQKYIDVFDGRFKELFPLRRYGRRSYRTAPIVTESGERQLNLKSDLFDKDLYDAKNEFTDTTPLHGIDDVEYEGEKIVLNVHSFFHRVNVHNGEQKVEAIMQNVITGEEQELNVTPLDGQYVTLRYGKVYDELTGDIQDYNYDGSAYRIEIDPGIIKTEKLHGDNIIIVRYANAVKTGSFFIRIPVKSELLLERLTGDSACNDKTSVEFGLDAQKALVLNVDNYGTHAADIGEEISKGGAWLSELRRENDTCIYVAVRLGKEAKEMESGSVRLCLADSLAGVNRVLDVTEAINEGEGYTLRYKVNFDAEELLHNLYDMQSDIVLQKENGHSMLISTDRKMRASIVLDRLAITMLANKNRKLSLLVVKQDYMTQNNIHYNRRILYPDYQKEKLDEKTVLFEAYWGAQYSCNPRALYEYINAEHPEYKCVWSLVDERTPINGTGIRVRRGSTEYYKYLATAKYLVNNVNFEKGYKKRPGQIEIQTMHGTPLKTVGLDVKEEFRTDEERVDYVKKNRRWNYLVAQGRFTEEKAGDWYGFNKEVLCTGYPRTDELYNISEEERKELKNKLGLPVDKKIIMYAPTFRKMGTYEMPVNLDLMKENLSDEFIFLIRLHHFASKAYNVPVDGTFIFDGGKYDSITDLYKITDILITDYSSVMFDFALTGKPMVFYTYDLEEYVGRTRGVYFDITKEAPGPLVKTNEELLEALKSGGKGNESRVQLFRDKYLTYECANSSEKIFNQVFVNTKRSTKDTLKRWVQYSLKAILPKKYYKRLRERHIRKNLNK